MQTSYNFGWRYHNYSSGSSDRLPSSVPSSCHADKAAKDYDVDAMQNDPEGDKQMMAIERAVEYFSRTHPNFEKCFVTNKQPRISFLEQRWKLSLLTSKWTELSDKIEKVKTLIGARVSALSVLAAPKVARTLTEEEQDYKDVQDERNRYFWILVELTLLYDDDYAIFCSLHFALDGKNGTNNVCRQQDEQTMINFLRKVKLWTLPSKLVKRAGEVHHNQKICEILETMFLRTPCQPLTTALGDYLPWTFLIDRATSIASFNGVIDRRDQWKSHAQQCFMPRLKELTNLITPINSSILEYLWDVDETKACSNVFIGRALSFDNSIGNNLNTYCNYLRRRRERNMETIPQMQYIRMMGDTEYVLMDLSRMRAQMREPTYVQLLGEMHWTVITPDPNPVRETYETWELQSLLSMKPEPSEDICHQTTFIKSKCDDDRHKRKRKNKKTHQRRADNFTSNHHSKSRVASSRKYDSNRVCGSRGR